MSAALSFDDLRGLYQATVIDRSRRPRFAGRREGAAVGEADNRMCGDTSRVFVVRGADGMLDVRHETRGCAICLASADLMAEAVRGRSAAAARDLAARFAACVERGIDDPALGALRSLGEVNAYPSRVRCATLPWSALGSALAGALGEA